MQVFTAAVKKLSSGISDASSLWKDSKYAELNSSVRQLASELRAVMDNGERFCQTLDRFESISAEQY